MGNKNDIESIEVNLVEGGKKKLVDLNAWEGFGLVVIEGMIKRKIVLASETGGIPEIITDGFNGFMFESQNSRSLTDKLTYIIERKDDLVKLKENAMESVKEKFDVRKNADLYYEVYIKKLRKKNISAI